MGGEIAEGTAAGAIGIHAPEVGGAGVGEEPILEVDGAEVVDAAEGAGIDEEAQLADGGDEAVVVGGHVFDAGGAGGFEHGQGFGGRAGERFFAEEVDALLGGGDAGFGVDVVGAAVIEELDVAAGEHSAPIGVGMAGAELAGGGFQGGFVAAAEGGEFGAGGGIGEHVVDLADTVAMGFAHESIAEQADSYSG